MSRLPTYYVSHGGGPWPWMREQNGARYAVLEASLQAMAKETEGQVRAILMVTAHWETPAFTLSSSPRVLRLSTFRCAEPFADRLSGQPRAPLYL